MAEVSSSNLARAYNFAVDKAERLGSQLSRYKARAEKSMQLATHATLTVAGGAVHGVLERKMPTIPNTEVRTSLALGSTLIAGSMFNMWGKYDEEALAVGGGLLAAEASRMTQNAL